SSLSEPTIEEKILCYKITLIVQSELCKIRPYSNTLGNALPELFRRAGLKNIDIRANDQVEFTLPPYTKESDQHNISQMNNITMVNEYENEMNTQIKQLYLQGGGTISEFDQYLSIIERYKKLNNQELNSQLNQENYYFCGSNSPLFITIGEK